MNYYLHDIWSREYRKKIGIVFQIHSLEMQTKTEKMERPRILAPLLLALSFSTSRVLVACLDV